MYEIGEAEISAVRKVILAKKLFRYQAGNNGECDRFEREFAKKIGVKYAIILSSGTNALVAALLATGIGPGDEVLVPAYTFVATAAAVVLVGAKPIVVNVDESLGFSVADARTKININTKAIIPVHMDGLAADLKGILALAKEHGIPVIEDCAQALGGSYGKKYLGSWGDVGAFSLNENKNLSCGEGGIVVCSNKNIYERLLHIHDLAARYNPVKKILFPAPMLPGMSMRVSEIQGAIMRVQLRRLDAILRSLRKRKALLVNSLADISGVRVVLGRSKTGDCGSSLHLRFDSQASALTASKKLLGNGITAHFPSLRPAHVAWKWVKDIDHSYPSTFLFDISPSMEILMTTLKYDINYNLSIAETAKLAKRLRYSLLSAGLKLKHG